MNKMRRELLGNALCLLERVSDTVSQVLYDEQDSLDNTPENFQYTDRYENAEEAVSHLEDAEELLHQAIEQIETAAAY